VVLGILTAFASFAAAALATWALGRWLTSLLERHPDLTRELRDSAARLAWPARIWQLGIQLAARELPQGRLESTRRRIAEDLTRVAAPPGLTPEIFLGRAVLEGLALAVGIATLTFASAGRLFLPLALGVSLFHAFGLRPFLLRVRAQERVNRIQKRLPYAIDLAVLVLKAGGTLREALALVSERADRDPLAEEVAVALTQIRTGTPQAKAMTDMADRIRLEDLSTLVIAINRGEQTGAPMARALETQAEIFRFRRMQRAERLAVEAPVKMMFPNMLIMLAVLLVVLGPVFVKLLTDGLF
jgi:tight adherence protein C